MEKIRRFELLIPERLFSELKALAKKEDRSVGACIRVMIDKKLKEDKE